MIYGLQNKHSDNILQIIVEFCLNNGFPEEFLSDNLNYRIIKLVNLELKIILDISKGFPITLILRMQLKDSTTLLKNT